MLIYKDIFSGDELCSDTFPTKLVDGLVLEFTGKQVVRKEGDIAIAGFNPSAEELEEGTDETATTGIDIILNHSLQDMTNVYGDVKVFKDWVKEYMKKLVDRLKEDGKSDEELKEFKTKMQEFVAGLMKKDRFKNLQFFAGAGENNFDGQLGILEYRTIGTDEKPVMMLVKAGLIEEKC